MPYQQARRRPCQVIYFGDLRPGSMSSVQDPLRFGNMNIDVSFQEPFEPLVSLLKLLVQIV